ncbi:MAG TPA: hypothetical protein VNG89_27825 [Vicinamibacterales bacterium]|nr:hypothetical protein [Vicinamibacterales bacterium]
MARRRLVAAPFVDEPNPRGTMRVALVVCAIVGLAACSGSSVAPSGVSASTTTSIAGNWNGTIGSSNNATMQLKMVLTQSGSAVHGTWDSTSVSWAGEITGNVGGSTFDGQFTFSGTASGGTVCTGTAKLTGPVTESTMTLTSATGVVGSACPAPLPVGVTIDARRQP